MTVVLPNKHYKEQYRATEIEGDQWKSRQSKGSEISTVTHRNQVVLHAHIHTYISK